LALKRSSPIVGCQQARPSRPSREDAFVTLDAKLACRVEGGSLPRRPSRRCARPEASRAPRLGRRTPHASTGRPRESAQGALADEQQRFARLQQDVWPGSAQGMSEWSEARQGSSLPTCSLKPHDRSIRDELISQEGGRVRSQTPRSGRDWGPHGPPPGGAAGPQLKPTGGAWRWYHRWWVMLGGILLALILGALALEAFNLD
jgi:hypothetical protein